MKQLMDGFSKEPVVSKEEKLPFPGIYYAVILDAQTRVIDPVYADQDTCLVVKYRLVDVDRLETHTFTETYAMYGRNPRADDFWTFVRSQAQSDDFTCDDELIGFKATVEVVYEFLGGFAHPIISFRPFLETLKSDDDLPF